MKASCLGPVVLVLLALRSECQTTADVQFMEAAPLGCFERGYKFDYYIPNTMINTTSLELCQEHCKLIPNCVKFLYYAFHGECWFADVNAVEQPIDSYLVIAGFRECTPEGMALPARCTTEMPSNGFPGANPTASSLAWPGGKQPFNLECWHKSWTGAVLGCNQIQTLDDTENGWPGKCMGLVEMPGINGTAACAASCEQNPLCPSWQTTVYHSCWQGLGKDCFVRGNFAPLKAKRIQHGSVRVLMNLKGWQIVGLYKAFDNSEGYFTNVQDAVDFCKKICYSDINCQYWTYAPNFGCWVEDRSQEYSPPYPLTLDAAQRDTAFALDCVAGEYISHYCPDQYISKVPPTVPKVLTECAEVGYRYEPPDMSLSGRLKAESYEACRQLCINTFPCTYFAYWPDNGCHLADSTAQKVVAESFEVISGPKDCSMSYTSTSPHPEAWALQSQTINPEIEAREAAPAVMTTDTIHSAEIRTVIHNLDISQVSDTDANSLKAKYAEAIARTIGVNVGDIKEARSVNALAARVDLSSLPPAGTELKAYTLNQPVNSPDPTRLQNKMLIGDFATSMKEATRNVLGTTSPAITGDLMISRPEVGTTAHPLPGLGHPNFFTSWWPLLVAIVIALCAGVVFFVHNQRDKQKYKNLKMQAERRSMSSDASMDSLDLETQKQVWASDPPAPPAGTSQYQPQSSGYRPQGRAVY